MIDLAGKVALVTGAAEARLFVAFLASDASAYISGAEVAIDGGLAAGKFVLPDLEA